MEEGIENIRIGIKKLIWVFLSKCPSFKNLIELRLDTETFRISAVGLIISTGIPKITIHAIWPDAPACPTIDYKKAIDEILNK